MLEIPVVFLLFNRPDLTARVWEQIAAQKPRHLLIIADGPRDEPERAKCDAARAVVQVDWPCELELCYSDVNLGCKNRVSSGLHWAFERVEAAIILEDDCLPHPDFFAFCVQMLEQYRDDKRVMMVSGDRFLPADESGFSHYFSRHVHIWGWATWRRAWRLYDAEMSAWKEDRARVVSLLSPAELPLYEPLFDLVAYEGVDTWDVQWMLTCFVQSGLSVIPDANLISNIGFRDDATRTKTPGRMANYALSQRRGTRVPTHVFPDRLNDALVAAMCLKEQAPPPLWRRAVRRIQRLRRR